MELERLLDQLWQNHRGKVIGVGAGLVFGILTTALGFWKTLFITLCIAVGYIIGKRVDENANFREMLVRVLRGR